MNVVRSLSSSNFSVCEYPVDLISPVDCCFCLHQNIRSLRKNFSILLAHLDSLNNLPIVIVLSEIWIYKNELDFYNIQGYSLFGNCNESYSAGGVAVYVRNGYMCNCSCDNLSSADVLKLSIVFENVVYTMLCVYRLHAFAKSIFICELDSILSACSDKNLIVIGDMNIDILNVIDKDSENFLLTMASHGLQSLINEPTRLTDSSKTCIDHIFIRCHKNNKNVFIGEVYDLKLSDHCTITLNYFSNKCFNNISASDKNKYCIDYTLLKQSLISECWNQVYSENNPSIAFDLFLKIFKTHINSSTSVKKQSSKKKHLKPWMTNYLLTKIRKKHKMSLKCKKHKSNKKLKKYYETLSKNLNKEIDETRNNYYTERFSRAEGNVREEWKVVDSILGIDRKSVKIDSIDINGVQESESLKVSNHFNEYFTEVSSKLVPSIEPCTNCDCSVLSDMILMDNMQPNSFVFETFSPGEVFKVIMSLKNKRSCTSDGVSTDMLKKVAWFVTDVLTHVFNKSVVNGTFPDHLKCAEVLPLFKKGDRKSISNYRPISILSTFSKIFERLLKVRIVSFLNKFDFFYVNQFGFRAGLSTEDAILRVCSQLYGSLNSNKQTVGLFIDMTKAFDLVNHDILLTKLYNAGFRGSFFNMLSSYLKNRMQKVNINGVYSEPRMLKHGVPQGSVLGPLFFLIYINSIFKIKLNGFSTAFADDIVLTYSSGTVFESIVKIEEDLENLRLWFACHKLVISEKTKLMFFKVSGSSFYDFNLRFHTHNCKKLPLPIHKCEKNYFDSNLQCTDDCFKIEMVQQFKYLGVIIDCNLNWKDHIQSINKTMLLVTRKMYLIKPYCSQKVLKMIYNGLANSKIQYGITSWGGSYANSIRPLLIAQKKLIRIILKRNQLHDSWPLFKELHILPIRHLYVFKVLREFFKQSGNIPSRNYQMYNLRVNNMNLVNVPFAYRTHFSHFYAYTAPNIFNKLPLYIRETLNISSFLKKVKDWLFTFNLNCIESFI